MGSGRREEGKESGVGGDGGSGAGMERGEEEKERGKEERGQGRRKQNQGRIGRKGIWWKGREDGRNWAGDGEK